MEEIITERPNLFEPNVYIYFYVTLSQAIESVVGIPVSVREKGNVTMGNFTSGISISHNFCKTRSFSENAKEVHEKINEVRENKTWFVLQFLQEVYPTLMDAVLLSTHGRVENRVAKHLGKIMRYAGKRVRDLGVTNLTELEIANIYGDYKIEDIRFIPPSVSYAHNVIGISTFCGMMTITYHHMEGKPKESVEFFQKGMDFIEKLKEPYS